MPEKHVIFKVCEWWYDTKEKELLWLWHFPEAKFGCNDSAAEQADNWGFDFRPQPNTKVASLLRFVLCFSV